MTNFIQEEKLFLVSVVLLVGLVAGASTIQQHAGSEAAPVVAATTTTLSNTSQVDSTHDAPTSVSSTISISKPAVSIESPATSAPAIAPKKTLTTKAPSLHRTRVEQDDDN